MQASRLLIINDSHYYRQVVDMRTRDENGGYDTIGFKCVRCGLLAIDAADTINQRKCNVRA